MDEVRAIVPLQFRRRSTSPLDHHDREIHQVPAEEQREVIAWDLDGRADGAEQPGSKRPDGQLDSGSEQHAHKPIRAHRHGSAGRVELTERDEQQEEGELNEQQDQTTQDLRGKDTKQDGERQNGAAILCTDRDQGRGRN